MQPQPLSDVNPVGPENCDFKRSPRDIPDVADGSADFGIGGKFERYVSQIRDSKSLRKADGQPSLEAGLPLGVLSDAGGLLDDREIPFVFDGTS